MLLQGHGTYAPYRGQFRCLQCPAGRFLDDDGTNHSKHDSISDCKICTSGQYQTESGQADCTQCAPGKYLSENGVNENTHDNENDCKDCSAGKFNPFMGAQICKDCATGMYNEYDGQVNCSLCNGCSSTGHMREQCGYNSSGICTKCSPGRYNNDKAYGTTCKPCSPGMVTSTLGSSICTACPSGKYQSSFAMLECINCGGCPLYGQKRLNCRKNLSGFCINCSSGFYNDVRLYTTHCKPCQFGTYVQSNTGNRKCNSCPKGKYGRVLNASTENMGCTNTCGSGRYGNTVGGTTEADACKNCEIGRFSMYNHTFCAKCPNGKYSSIVAGTSVLNCTEWTDCKAGYMIFSAGNFNSDRSCSKCTPGKYSVLKNSLDCATCPVGKYHDLVGASSVHNCTTSVRCHPGSYIFKESTATSPRQCSKCGPGKYQDEENKIECKNCIEGRYNNLVGANNLMQNCTRSKTCIPGQSVLFHGNLTHDRTCRLCNQGKFSNKNNTLVCSPWQKCYASKEYVYRNGSSQADRVCKICSDGTYTSEDNDYVCTLPKSSVSPLSCVFSKTFYDHLNSVCKKCSTCGSGRYVHLKCTTSRNTVCSPCEVGFYQPDSNFLGYRCTKCPYGKHGMGKGQALEAAACAVDPPSQPENFELDTKSATSLTFSWSPPLFDGGDRVRYLININDTISQTEELSINSITYSNLSPSTVYKASLQFVNKYGVSEKNILISTTLSLPKPKKPVLNFQQAIIFESKKFSFSWKGVGLVSNMSYYEYQIIPEDLAHNAQTTVSYVHSGWSRVHGSNNSIEIHHNGLYTPNMRLKFQLRAVNAYQDINAGTKSEAVGRTLEVPFVVEAARSPGSHDLIFMNKNCSRIQSNNISSSRRCILTSDTSAWTTLNETGQTIHFEDDNEYAFKRVGVSAMIRLVSRKGATLRCIDGPCFVSAGGLFPQLIQGFKMTGTAVVSKNTPQIFDSLPKDTKYGQGGGCIQIEDIDYIVTIQDVSLSQCYTNGAYGGGAILISNSRNVYLNNVTIVNSLSQAHGGGIFITNSNYVNVVDSSIHHNYAHTGSGGGVAIIGKKTFDGDVSDVGIKSKEWVEPTVVEIHNSKIFDNHANSTTYMGSRSQTYKVENFGYGGGIYVSNAELHSKNLYIGSNIAQKKGGGMCVLDSSVSLHQATVRENTVIDGHGGGIASWNSHIEFFDSSISFNEAIGMKSDGGGGCFELSSIVTFSNCTIRSNTASGHGGGVFFSMLTLVKFVPVSTSNDTVNASVTTIADNFAGRNGGGISCFQCRSLIVKNVTFLRNSAAISGGCIAFEEMEPQKSSILRFVIFNSCMAQQGNGGAIAVRDANKITIELSKFVNCYAVSGIGAGVFWTHFEIMVKGNHEIGVPVIIIQSSIHNERNFRKLKMSVSEYSARDDNFIATSAYSLSTLDGPVLSTAQHRGNNPSM